MNTIFSTAAKIGRKIKRLKNLKTPLEGKEIKE